MLWWRKQKGDLPVAKAEPAAENVVAFPDRKRQEDGRKAIHELVDQIIDGLQPGECLMLAIEDEENLPFGGIPQG